MINPSLHDFPRTLASCVSLFLLIVSLTVVPLQAAEPSSRSLDAGWQFRAVANSDRA
ncbi:MAG: hypothetical protein QOF56_1321, partial [Acidobacteriaceae bacterium]|nr:hypothetical protein [Acidobacteriaceae bacterium]